MFDESCPGALVWKRLSERPVKRCSPEQGRAPAGVRSKDVLPGQPGQCAARFSVAFVLARDSRSLPVGAPVNRTRQRFPERLGEDKQSEELPPNGMIRTRSRTAPGNIRAGLFGCGKDNCSTLRRAILPSCRGSSANSTSERRRNRAERRVLESSRKQNTTDFPSLDPGASERPQIEGAGTPPQALGGSIGSSSV